MWSQAVLFLLVGLAFGSNNPGWTDNQEYVYRVRGRTLTGFLEVSDQLAGFLYRATLRIQPRSDGQQLQALITDPEYTQIHSAVGSFRQTEFPEEELSWKPLAMSQQPFQMQMENGKIVNLVVSKKISNWEANMIKGMAQLFQMNVNGENALPSTLNSLPEEHSKDAVFVSMEDTVTGETETLYQIRRLPEHLMDDSEQGKHFEEWLQNGDIYEVIKHQNYSNYEELPLYASGTGDHISGGQPATNEMAEFFTRDSTGRAILLGSLKHYIMVNSTFVNTILVNPTITDLQKAGVLSAVEAGLKEIKSQDEKIGNIPEPIQLGNLVYSYNEPLSQTNQVDDTRKAHQRRQQEENYDNESGKRFSGAYNRIRPRRSINDYSRDSNDDKYYYTQEQPKINQAPQPPLLGLTTGYEGKPIKKAGNIVEGIKSIAKKIGNELQDSLKEHHEKTLERFVKLTGLIRFMDSEELQQISEQLYSQSQEGTEKATWHAFRDSVSHAGTGPSLLTIVSWIESGKIKGYEAAQVVTATAKSISEPTLPVMKAFFKLTKNEKVLHQEYLNDTALLSFAQLVRAAYVDKKFAESEYPINAFGPFRTEEAKRFVREEVILHYTEMLKQAVQEGDAPKIHAYIATLGNIAHPKILAAFEPFLEGKEQCSQFQRLLMVLHLRRLAEVYPETALAVLFRTYQNPAEHPAVRVAAALYIMYSEPTTEILQIMAKNTNIERNDHVNAAVKFAIEQLSEVEDEEFATIRDQTILVRPLLTKKVYGLNYGGNYLRAFYIEQLKKLQTTYAYFIPSEDTHVPKGLGISLTSSLAGLHHEDIYLKGLVSSINQLIDVTNRQTKNYGKQQKQQQEHAEEQAQYPWSSQKIAKLLNIKSEEREQLEAFLSLQIGACHGMFSVDNNTIGQLPKFIQEWEQELRNGQKINKYKFFQSKEIIVAVPTATGVPAIYHYASPMLFKAQGEITAVATPQLSEGRYVQQPDQVKIDSVLRITVSGKTQGRISVVAPFDHQRYISGYDKHWELNLPEVKTVVKVDLKEKELQVDIEPKQENKMRMVHYRTWPYTAKSDVMNHEPLSAQEKNVMVVQPKNMQGYKVVVGEKSTGIALEVELNHERKNVHIDLLKRIFSNDGLFEGLRELWEDAYVHNSQFDITYLPEESWTEKITLRSKYDEDYQETPKSTQQGKWKLNWKAEPSQRQQELMDEVSADIKNVKVIALDNTIQFKGQNNIQYLLSFASAKSNVDPKSRARICFKKSSEDQEVKDYETHVVFHNQVENTNGMDVENSLQEQPQMDTEIEVVFGYSEEKLSKLKAKIQQTRSEERKCYLKDLPMYKQCKEEMKRGDKALDACTRMNMVANLLDRTDIKLEHTNLRPKFVEAIQMVFEAGRFYASPNLEINNIQKQLRENEITMKVKFHGDLKYLNATVQTPNEETIVKNIPVHALARQIVVPHPSFHVRARVMSHIFGINSYREFCTVDETRISTFNNKTYDAEISKKWTVMALYAPKLARQDENQQEQPLSKQLKYQLENLVVLVRKNKESQDKKDVKIVASNPDTHFQIVEIEMQPSQGEQKAKVTINGKQIQVSQERSYDVHDGYVQVYALPNGEVKVELDNAFYIIYDGKRARLTAVNDKLKDATIGLCGQFNDQPREDFLVSERCIARKAKKFVKSFEVEGDEGKQIREELGRDNKQCVEKEEPLYVNVITERDINRWDDDSEEQEASATSYRAGRQCWTQQTRYIQKNGEICFTVVPVPVCRSECRATNFKSKPVGVHCVQQTSASDLWKTQIDNGGSPNFSNKEKHRTIQMPVPDTCSA